MCFVPHRASLGWIPKYRAMWAGSILSSPISISILFLLNKSTVSDFVGANLKLHSLTLIAISASIWLLRFGNFSAPGAVTLIAIDPRGRSVLPLPEGRVVPRLRWTPYSKARFLGRIFAATPALMAEGIPQFDEF